MKSFNDLRIKSNSFCHLRNSSTGHLPQGAPLWNRSNYFLATLNFCPILPKRGIVAYQLELSPYVSSHNPDVCFVSQLKRWFMSHSVSCLSVARSLRRSILLDFPFLLVIMLDGVLKARRRDKDDDRINVLMKCNLDREDRVSFASPLSSHLTS